jgi:integrase/recombinase XerD
MMQAATITDQQLKRLMGYITTQRHAVRNRALVLMTYYSGMRVGEVAALSVSDVLDADGKIKDEIRLTSKQTKGNKGRVVVIPAKLKVEILNYLKSRFIKTDLAELLPAQTRLHLFYTQKRTGFSANTLTQYFHKLYKDAGINGASSHSGRRTFITNLANKGINVRVLMQLAGHKNISTTQRYIDCNDGMLRAAVELI